MSGQAPKVIMTTDAVGGVWTFATNLASGLAAAGSEIHLVSLGPQPRSDQRAAIDPRIHFVATDLALEWQDPEGADIHRAHDFFRKLEDSVQPDVVHLNSYREAAFDWTAPVVVAAHSCVFSWAAACKETEFLVEPKWRAYFEAVASGVDSAKTWVAPSGAFHRIISDLYRPRTPGEVIWNGLTFSPEVPAHEENVVLAAGRIWDRAKNISVLTEAAGRIDWPIMVAGPTIADRQAPHGIDFLGPLSSVALRDRMKRAAIFASPALYEPFGLAVLEAASSGCALILSDIQTFRELWDGAAVFVDAEDAAELQRELNALIRDKRRRTKLQHAARRRARRYSAEKMTAAFRALYSGLIFSRFPAASFQSGAHA